MTSGYILIAVSMIFGIGSDALQGFDMQGGIPQGTVNPCTFILFKAWKSEDAGKYQLADGGKVAVSESGENSCMKSPDVEVRKDDMFMIQFFVSESDAKNDPEDAILKLSFYLDGTLISFHEFEITRKETTPGWNTIARSIPTNFITGLFSRNLISINAFDKKTLIALKWFGFGKNIEELPILPSSDRKTTTTTTTTPITTTTSPATTTTKKAACRSNWRRRA